jgi:hypothetical protein
LAGAIFLVVSACGGSNSSEPASAPTSGDVAASESSAPLEPVLVATASGGQLDFNSLRGQDVLLWFWAPW